MDPREVWLSDNFRLSDFLGNHSVYALGMRNQFDHELTSIHMQNAAALCERALEPIRRDFGPVSICYGFISDAFSRARVTYQDPAKPSHHRWDLGAAADIIVHNWVNGAGADEFEEEIGPYHDSVRNSPALLAHFWDRIGIPYSRMITYSESPAVCIAVSAQEIESEQPRKAFYENRYQGSKCAKPEYIRMPNQRSRGMAYKRLLEEGLKHPWRGGGYPSYHGGGIKQYQHRRVSRYTTVLDWLFSMESIQHGAKNIPAMSEDVTQAFSIAGRLYDALVDARPTFRIPILRGFVCRTHPSCAPGYDWRGSRISFEVGAPCGVSSKDFAEDVFSALKEYPSVAVSPNRFGCEVSVDRRTFAASL